MTLGARSQDAIQKLNGDLDGAKWELSGLHDQVKRLQAALLAEEGRNVELESERNKLTDELAALKAQLAEALARADELADTVDKQNRELQNLDEVWLHAPPPPLPPKLPLHPDSMAPAAGTRQPGDASRGRRTDARVCSQNLPTIDDAVIGTL